MKIKFEKNSVITRKPNRLKKYDYSTPGYYYVTINIYDDKESFGEVKAGKVILSAYGKIAEKIWKKIPEHFEIVDLDEYIIMPNHVHGIVVIKDVGGRHACPDKIDKKKRAKQLLPAIMGAYKSAVTKQINQSNRDLGFRWQRSYYDHVIRDEKSLTKIREYIRRNPEKLGMSEKGELSTEYLKGY